MRWNVRRVIARHAEKCRGLGVGSCGGRPTLIEHGDAVATGRSAPKIYKLMVVVNGWRGKAIDRALHAYAREVSGLDSRTIELLD